MGRVGVGMDIVEAGGMGARTSVVELRARGSRVRFTLYPMSHVADPAFYAEVSARLARHDLIVAEGVRGRSRAVRLLTLGYRMAGRSRFGLQVQPKRLHEVGVPVVLPDITGPEFQRRWGQIELRERALVCLLVPPVAVYLTLFGTRRWIANHVALDDDILNVEEPSGTGIEKLVSDYRDALLCAALTEIHETPRDADISVAVVYGAGHVRPVVDYLRSRHGYVVHSGEWLTLFIF
jgi:hypothetical protein